MKRWAWVFLLMTYAAAAQQEPDSCASEISFVPASQTGICDSLATELTARYRSDADKVRAIFNWIAQNIAYNTGIYNRTFRKAASVEDEPDTTSVWKDADEMVAERVLGRGVAVCDGYARLLKTLCLKAGVPAEVIVGYVNPGFGNPAKRFRTNHSWNAVLVDGRWQLLDVTWASGYVNYRNEFVFLFDDRYFFAPPSAFIQDHFPEDPWWTLLENVSPIAEFRKSPYRAKAYPKYGIVSYSPATGIIEAAPGDTVRIEVQLKDLATTRKVASSYYGDSLPPPAPGYQYVEPAVTKENTLVYLFPVQSPAVNSLQLVYNKDVILHYRIHIRQSTAFK